MRELKCAVALRKRSARSRAPTHCHRSNKLSTTRSRASARKRPGPYPKSKANSAFSVFSAYSALDHFQQNSILKEASRMSSYRCVLLLITTLISAATLSAQPKAGALKINPYTFENDQKQKVDAEFGTLLVPENRSNPQSNLIELAFVRFKSTAKNPGPPIVYLAGGPGGSGIFTAKGSRFPLFMALREIADVIAYDQRGTGYSKPNLGCFDRLSLPLDAAPTREAAIKELLENSRGCVSY